MPPVSVPRPSSLELRCKELGGTSCTTMLVAVGEALRHEATPESAVEIERALSTLSVADVASALVSVDVEATKHEVQRAGSEAFEAAFADSDEERTLFQKSAVQALFSRDRLASMIAAADAKRRAHDGADAETLGEAVREARAKTGALDLSLKSVTRALTAINGERRAALARLTEAARAEAWWYLDRSAEADDDLLGTLGSLDRTAPAGCHSAELGRAALPKASRLEASALHRVSLRTDGAAERAFLEARATRSTQTKSALELASAELDEG